MTDDTPTSAAPQDRGPLSGVIPIPVTTFHDDGGLDLDGLAAQVRFGLESGAHGVLYPGVVSEFYTLTDDERRAAVETVVTAADGRVPAIVGVTGASTASAVAFAEHASSIGADAVMTMVPYVQHFFSPTTDFARDHMVEVARAAGVPVILQNARVGFPLGVGAVSDVVRQVPGIRYVKQESNPPTHGISEIVEALGDRIDGVFGGVGGVYLVNELDRGAVGTMPSPAFVDRIVNAYDLYREAGADAAQELLETMGSLFTREVLYNVVFHKEVLRRRGVIGSTRVRIASPSLDAVDLADLDRLLDAADVR
jgi:4-hydroxy-tetrahydrodipicolinate synthase